MSDVKVSKFDPIWGFKLCNVWDFFQDFILFIGHSLLEGNRRPNLQT